MVVNPSNKTNKQTKNCRSKKKKFVKKILKYIYIEYLICSCYKTLQWLAFGSATEKSVFERNEQDKNKR